MSRAAQAVEQAVKELKKQSAMRPTRRTRMNDDEVDGQEEVTAGDVVEDVTTQTEGERMPGKKAAKKKSAPKPKKEKKAKAKKSKVQPTGQIVDVKASGETYLSVIFEEGNITLTPTSNRQVNRDVIVKSLRELISK